MGEACVTDTAVNLRSSPKVGDEFCSRKREKAGNSAKIPNAMSHRSQASFRKAMNLIYRVAMLLIIIMGSRRRLPRSVTWCQQWQVATPPPGK